MDYFSIDVEASGPIPGIHNLLSIGATHVRRSEGLYRPFEDFYVEVKPAFDGYLEAAMRIHKLDAERLKEEGTAPKEAFEALTKWVRSHQKSKKDRPVFVAHNAAFDWMYCAWYYGWTEVKNPFGHSALDTKALAMGKLNISWVETSLKNVADKLPNVALRDTSTLHHAGADARYQAEVFCDLMNLKASHPI